MNILQINFFLCLSYTIIIQSLNVTSAIKDKIFLVVTYIQLLVLHSFVEYESVPDLTGYLEMFEIFGTSSWIECLNFTTGIEPGYALVNKIIYSIGLPFRAVIIVYSFCFLTILYRLLRKYSCSVTFSVIIILITFFNQSLFVLRQFWALSIIFFSYKYVIERKILPFLILLIIASSLHITALVTLPLYYLYSLSKRNLLSILIVLCFLTKIGLKAVLVYGALILEAKSEYLVRDSFMSYVPLLESVFLLFIYCIVLKDKVFENGINRLLFILSAISVCICFGAAGESAIFIRLNLYFSVTPFLILPKIVRYGKGISNKLIISTLILIIYYLLTFESSSFKYLKELQLVLFN